MPKQHHFYELFLRSKDGLSRLVGRIVPPTDIEDVVQETYVKLCQINNVDSIRQPQAFMYRTAKNLALDFKKQARVRLTDHIDDWHQFEETQQANNIGDNVYNQHVTNKEFGELCEAIRQLPKQCQKVFVLRKVYGYSQKDIQQKLGISQSTVEKHVSTGMKKCIEYARRNKQNSEVAARSNSRNA